MRKIRVGLAGCGFVSELHMYAYRRVYGVDVEVKAVAARGDQVVEFARKHSHAQLRVNQIVYSGAAAAGDR